MIGTCPVDWYWGEWTWMLMKDLGRQTQRGQTAQIINLRRSLQAGWLLAELATSKSFCQCTVKERERECTNNGSSKADRSGVV